MIFNFYIELQKILGTISVTKIFGIVPLGMVLHIGISAAITILLLKRGMKFKKVFVIVFLVGLSKEILDCFVINNTLQKHILDMCYDMSYPTFLYLSDKARIKIKEIKSRPKL
ncbi:MAG: hypothetical protein WC635_04900 [Bacteriovorax sp.]|jgi:hypothetical protein